MWSELAGTINPIYSKKCLSFLWRQESWFWKTNQYRVKKQYSSSNFFFFRMGPLPSYLNKRRDHSFILKEVYPDEAHTLKPRVFLGTGWVSQYCRGFRGQILYFYESLRRSQYRLLKHDTDYLKVILDSLLMFVFKCYFYFPKSCSNCTNCYCSPIIGNISFI